MSLNSLCAAMHHIDKFKWDIENLRHGLLSKVPLTRHDVSANWTECAAGQKFCWICGVEAA
jgi:hypothetical protein